jgi:hypothetical protein
MVWVSAMSPPLPFRLAPSRGGGARLLRLAKYSLDRYRQRVRPRNQCFCDGFPNITTHTPRKTRHGQ